MSESTSRWRAGALPIGNVLSTLRNTSPSVRRPLLASVVASLVFIAGLIFVGSVPAYATTHTVVISGFSFTPATLNVAPGDTVTWINQETDGTVHTVTADNGSFNSGNLAPGQSFSRTFAAAGTFGYHCSIHTFMTATVTVGATPTQTATPTSTATPTPTVTPTPSPTTTPTPTLTPTPTATPTVTPTPTPTGATPCTNPTVGADQGDGTRLATFTVDPDGTKVFKICIAPIQWTVSPGDVRSALAFNGVIPGPTIKVNQGDKLKFIVQNNMTEHTGMHWHGMQLPNDQDGVPFLTQPPIDPGQIYTYQWTAVTTGTHWYHTHMGGVQVGRGLYGAFIVTPTLGDIAADKHYTIEVGDGSNGFTFNGKSFPATVPLVAKVGQTVHIRLIGTGPELIHPIHLHGMQFQVVAQDGTKLPAPYTADTILVGVGQTYDLIAQPRVAGHWLLHCHIFSHSEGPDGMQGLVTTLEVSP